MGDVNNGDIRPRRQRGRNVVGGSRVVGSAEEAFRGRLGRNILVEEGSGRQRAISVLAGCIVCLFCITAWSDSGRCESGWNELGGGSFRNHNLADAETFSVITGEQESSGKHIRAESSEAVCDNGVHRRTISGKRLREGSTGVIERGGLVVCEKSNRTAMSLLRASSSPAKEEMVGNLLHGDNSEQSRDVDLRGSYPSNGTSELQLLHSLCGRI
jgi:hypothetical protein